ncbi:hypothetical protein BN2475_90112 [Paraburkholderia ribeironis]|uniref:Uncharacterized protein n=1 Tax=Paraburkholderia ribeironis TaxID=1247936 RepID=A0A1N7RNG6_9BURK|nr:hypothetical protein BN2475_90112 [Paraburkholderia ribeironis]
MQYTMRGCVDFWTSGRAGLDDAENEAFPKHMKSDDEKELRVVTYLRALERPRSLMKNCGASGEPGPNRSGSSVAADREPSATAAAFAGRPVSFASYPQRK